MLDTSMFDTKFDKKDNWGCKGQFRGPLNRKIEYYPPYGWTGYGLNVLGKYEDDDWLSNKNIPGAWWIAYHGVGSPSDKIKEKPGYTVTKNILKTEYRTAKFDEFDKNGKIIVNDEREQFNYHKQDFDLNHPGKSLKTGAYFTPFIDYAEHYSSYRGTGFMHENKRYSLVFMCRVNPEKVQIRGRVNAEWICSGTSDEVRPYRILIKEVDENRTDEQNAERFYEERKRKVNIIKDDESDKEKEIYEKLKKLLELLLLLKLLLMLVELLEELEKKEGEKKEGD